ncbi:MAG: hypothetical protein IPG78_09645 [Ignavibacteria bacterium]|nr:hypothetical protein [Ignavibacteria bacterium]
MDHKHKISLLLLFSLIFIYGWGASGHKIINRRSTISSPPLMGFLNWSDSLAAHSSDADYRRNTDTSEARDIILILMITLNLLQTGEFLKV